MVIALTTLLAARATGGGLGNLLTGGAAAAAARPVPPDQAQGGLLGGLSGLLQRFQQGGQCDIINSWIGSGQNGPIAPDQLHQALGPEAVNNLSRLTGVAPPDLSAELARVLPGVVDRLTPHGRMPSESEMAHW